MAITFNMDDSPTVRADNERAEQLHVLKASVQDKVRRLSSLEDSGRDARVAQLADGRQPSSTPSTKAQLADAVTLLGDIDAAIDLHRTASQERRREEGVALCKKERPTYDKLAKRFAANFSAAFADYTELSALKGSLIAQSVPFYPILCDINSEAEDVFGGHLDRDSVAARLLRACVACGHLSKLPESLR